MIKNNDVVRASCHCGAIKLDIFLSNGLDEIVRCNCSICSRTKGFAMLCIPSNDVSVVEGRESITEYVFNTASSPHFFCIICSCQKNKRAATWVLLLSIIAIFMCFSIGNYISKLLLCPLIGWLIFALLMNSTEVQSK